MGIWKRWKQRRVTALFERHAAEIYAAALEDDAEEAEAARQRVLELARRPDPDPAGSLPEEQTADASPERKVRP